jgi:hypothetical protein
MYDEMIKESDQMLKKIDFYKERVNYQKLKKGIDCYLGTKGIFKEYRNKGSR